MDVNYKKNKRYNTAKYPIRQPIYLTWLIWVLSKIVLANKRHRVEKINMEELKPPYMLLSNHMSFIDFELAALGTYPHRVNNVVNIDGYYNRPWLSRERPNCLTEHKMDSCGTEIFCTECNKRWQLNEDGTLSALTGETEFSHVPDWFEWEKEQVKKQVDEGTYYFEDTVDVHSMPGCWKFEPLGSAKLTHDFENGFVLEGHYNGQDYRIQRKPLQINSLHIEYDFPHIKPFDCVDISTANDSFYCFPTKENVVTKLAFATEIIYQKKYELLRARKIKK